jgi:hypothetical protein
MLWLSLHCALDFAAAVEADSVEGFELRIDDAAPVVAKHIETAEGFLRAEGADVPLALLRDRDQRLAVLDQPPQRVDLLAHDGRHRRALHA